jgi:uncharacterized Fe-S cluster-containing radical SAM superfamily protein
MTHCCEVLSHLPKDLAFILETNGIILGAGSQWAKEWQSSAGLHQGKSQGCTPEEFCTLPEFRRLCSAAQGLEHLLAGVDCHAAVMVSFSSGVRRGCASIWPPSPGPGDFEAEELILCQRWQT